MKPVNMTRIIQGKRYETQSASLIAHDAFHDGHNWERSGRNTFLFRTRRANFFAQYQTKRPGEDDRLEALDVDAALTLFDSLPVKEVELETAFPGIQIVDA